MSASLVVGTGFFLGGILAVFALAGWRAIVRRVERRDLAAALTGEIVAVLQTIDAEAESLGTTDAPAPNLLLPQFTIYKANAYRLDRFAPPLALKIPLFFDRLDVLARECRLVQAMPSHGDAAHARSLQDMRADLKSSLELGDELLLALRPLVSPHSQAKHLM